MFSFITTLPSGMMLDSLKQLWNSTGFVTGQVLSPLWQNLIMLVIASILIYLAVVKEFEPNLLLAIGFGMFLINIPGAYNILYGIPVVWDPSDASVVQIAIEHGIDTSTLQAGDFLLAHGSKIVQEGSEGIFYYLYKGVDISSTYLLRNWCNDRLWSTYCKSKEFNIRCCSSIRYFRNIYNCY